MHWRARSDAWDLMDDNGRRIGEVWKSRPLPRGATRDYRRWHAHDDFDNCKGTRPTAWGAMAALLDYANANGGRR